MIHLLFDNDKHETVSTDDQWHKFYAWGRSVNAPELKTLLDTARSDNLPALTEQLADAQFKTPPNAEIEPIVVKAISVLERFRDANAVIVTDGEASEHELLQKALTAFGQQQADMVKVYEQSIETLQKAALVIGEQVQSLAARPEPVQPIQTEVKLALPPGAEMHQQGTTEAITKAIFDGIQSAKLLAEFKPEFHASPITITPATVELKDARPFVVPELQIIPRLLESLTSAVIELQRAVVEFSKPKKPIKFTMRRNKDGEWELRGQ